MATLPKLLRSQSIIRFQDCDPYNHLNNSKYIDYFMNAREDQVVEAYDFDVYKVGKERGIGWMVVFNQVAYFEPAVLMETVEITSRITELTKRKMLVEFQMLNVKTGKVKCLMWTLFAHVDLRLGRSREHDQDLMDRFSEVVMPTDEERFDERMVNVRQGIA